MTLPLTLTVFPRVVFSSLSMAYDMAVNAPPPVEMCLPTLQRLQNAIIARDTLVKFGYFGIRGFRPLGTQFTL